MKKFLKYAHRYLGYLTGVVVCVVCLTGAILVFEKEGTAYLNRELTTVTFKEGAKALNIEELLGKVESDLNGPVSKITVSSNPSSSWIVSANDPRKNIYVNPYTADIIGSADSRHPFFVWVMKLHRFLLLDKIGRVIVGTSTILFSLILVSGLILWLPRWSGQSYLLSLKKKASFSKGGNRYRMLYDWHVIPGLVVLPFLLIMALTGPTWSFIWYKSGFYSALLAKVPERREMHDRDRNAKGTAEDNSRRKGLGKDGAAVIANTVLPYMYLNDAIGAVVGASPKAYTLTVNLPMEKGCYTIAAQGKNPLTRRHLDTFTYSVSDKRIVKQELWSQRNRSEKLSTWIYAFHAGTWGGVISKVIYLLVVLAGMAIPMLGYAMLLARRRRKV